MADSKTRSKVQTTVTEDKATKDVVVDNQGTAPGGQVNEPDEATKAQREAVEKAAAQGTTAI